MKTFRVHYRDPKIAKNAIFDYIYGVRHAPDFSADAAPTIWPRSFPESFADDFRAFAAAGR